MLSGFDRDIYDTVQVGEIVEVRGSSHLPKWEHFVSAYSSISQWLPIMKALGHATISELDSQMIDSVMSNLANKKEHDDAVLTVEPTGAPKFPFVARLKLSNIRLGRDRLEGQVTMVGKIQRRLDRGQKIEVFRLANIEGLEAFLRSQQKNGPRGKIQRSQLSDLDEIVSYPAFEVTPIAIFF